VHFSMVALRMWESDFRVRSTDGIAADWPISYADLEPFYDEVERELGISGPMRWPWGPRRGPHPYREHPLNGVAQLFARGCDALGIAWAPAPLATISGARSQVLGPTVALRVTCRDEPCRASVTSTIRVPRIGRARARTYRPAAGVAIGAGTAATVRLRLSATARAAIRRALRSRKRVTARVAASAGGPSPSPPSALRALRAFRAGSSSCARSRASREADRARVAVGKVLYSQTPAVATSAETRPSRIRASNPGNAPPPEFL